MKVENKFSKLIHRLETIGFIATIYHYADWFLKHASPHYGMNRDEVSKLPLLRRIFFLAEDSFFFTADKVMTWYGKHISGRSEINTKDLEPHALYFLERGLLHEHSVIYSCGVGRNIDFDLSVAQQYRTKIYLFDPTELAIECMKKYSLNSNLIFSPVGVWTESTVMKFFGDRTKTGTVNLSLMNIFHTGNFIEAECFTLRDLMEKRGHDHLDLLKLDIEGAALPVLLQMLRETVLRPKQIVAELEIPKFIYGATLTEVFRFFRTRKSLFQKLNAEGYRLFTYGKAEFLAVQKI